MQLKFNIFIVAVFAKCWPIPLELLVAWRIALDEVNNMDYTILLRGCGVYGHILSDI